MEDNVFLKHLVILERVSARFKDMKALDGHLIE